MLSLSHRRLRNTFTAALLFVCTAAFTLYQNTRVAVLWDISFFLDTAYRWTLHQLPYRDLPFPYPPLFFLLHAAIIDLFGRVYYPHIVCAALEAGLATLLTWRILLAVLIHEELPQAVIPAKTESQYLPPAGRPWFLAALVTTPLTVLGIYGVYPHPIYDSDTILTVLITVYLLQRLTPSPIRNLLTGAACVLPLFFKQNIGLPFLLVTLLSVAAIAIARYRNREPIAPQLWLFTGALAALASALLAIQRIAGLGNYLHWTIAFAAQRRLPGLGIILGIYHQTSLLWTIPTAIAALVLLKLRPAARWTNPLAILLIAAPFLWTIASLALTDDSSDRADQLLSLWPHLLILSAAFALWNLRTRPTMTTLLPVILLATIHGTFLSQQLWGSTYAIWPLLMILIACLLTQIPAIARPVAAVITSTFLLCGGLYALSHDRLSYDHLDGTLIRTTLPPLRGLATPGPWIPNFENLIRFTNAEIPATDQVLLIPGEVPFYFATGRTPSFPILLFDPATDPFTPQQTLEQARAHNVRWLIVTRDLQLTALPNPDLPEIVRTLQQDYTPYRTLPGYDIYRRK